MNGNAGCESDIHPADQFRHEHRCGLLRLKNRNPVFCRILQKNLIRLQLSAENKARAPFGKQLIIDFFLALRSHIRHIGIFHKPQNLNACCVKVFEISGQLHRRTVDIRLLDLNLGDIYLRRQVNQFLLFNYFAQFNTCHL